METKHCGKCNRDLPLDRFPKYKDGYITPCKDCRSSCSREWSLTHRERHLENKRRSNKNHAKENYERQRVWVEKNKDHVKSYLAYWHSQHLPESRIHERSSYYKLKDTIFEAYGNKCNYCGIDDPDVLVIDHVNDNGAEERRIYKSMYSYFRRIIERGYPEDYQLLCQNCNWKKRLFSFGDIYDIN